MTEAATRHWRERYELIDLVAQVAGSTLWRAYDNRLRRTVGLRIVDGNDARTAALAHAAVAAAHITDRRFANVLDVMGPEPDDELVIITEWIAGLSLPEVLQEPMTAHAATVTVGQAARAIASAHAQGVTHGRLRPATIMVQPDGSVRVRGHGVDASLYGREPDLEPVAADIHGIGSLLYACLSARWPFPTEVGLQWAPGAQRGNPAPVRGLVAEVPQDLARIVDRCWRGQYSNAADLAADLRTQAAASWASPRGEIIAKRRRRILVGGFAGALTGTAVVMGLADAASRPGDPVTAQTRAQGVADLVPGLAPDERRLPIVSAKDYDPYGVDGESPTQVKFALDGKPLTAWTTMTYYDPALGGKPGVGLRVDLGAPRSVTSVDLQLVGANSNLTVLIADRKHAVPDRYRTFASVTGAGRHILLRSARPMTGRYVVVWFTRLPWIDGGYRGGVRSIVIRSG